MATLTPAPIMSFFDSNGDPLAGGKVYTYESGTVTPLATYTDAGGLTPNANPVILDSRGQADIWLGPGIYTFLVKDADDVEQPDGADDIAGVNNSATTVYNYGTTNAQDSTVKAELQKTAYVSSWPTLNLALADLGATEATLVIDAPTTLTADLVVPSTLTLEKKRAGVISGAFTFSSLGSITCEIGELFASDVIISGDLKYNNTPNVETIAALRLVDGNQNQTVSMSGYYAAGDGGGGSFYWDAASTEADNGGTIIKVTAVTTGRWKRIYSGAVDVKWFGAKADGVTNDRPFIQNAVDFLIEEAAGTLFFSTGIYILDTSVLINCDSIPSIRFDGTSTQAMTSGGDLVGAIIKGTGDAMFTFTSSNITVGKGFAFTCENLTFADSPATVALENNVGGYPARNFSVSNCTFKGVHTAILSDITASGLTTGIYVVEVTNCNIYDCTYAIYGKGQSAIGGLVVVGNTIEQNTNGIYTEPISNGSLMGSCIISDNLLEGQANAIVLNSGLSHIEVTRNYFESNTGYLVFVGDGNDRSSVKMSNNFVLSSSTAKIEIRSAGSVIYESSGLDGVDEVVIEGGRVDSTVNKINVPTTKVTVTTNSVVKPGNSMLDMPDGVFISWNYSGGGYLGTVTPAAYTPFGRFYSRTLDGISSDVVVSMPLVDDELVIINMLVQRGAINETLYATLLTDSGFYISNTETSASFANFDVGEWALKTFVLRSGQNLSGFKLRLNSSGPLLVTEAYVYTLPAASGNEIVCGMPSCTKTLSTVEKGQYYPQTDVSGLTSIVDTGITRNLRDVGYYLASLYQVTIGMTPNGAGNINRTTGMFYVALATVGSSTQISVQTVTTHSFAGINHPALTCVFWDGATESATLATASDAELRIKVTNYISATGTFQDVCIKKVA